MRHRVVLKPAFIATAAALSLLMVAEVAAAPADAVPLGHAALLERVAR